MKIVLVSDEKDLIDLVSSKCKKSQHSLKLFSRISDPLDIVSSTVALNPSLFILDDDFSKPYSAQIIKSLKKLKRTIKTIFITSDNQIELGREISQIGIFYYAIKPIGQTDITSPIDSISLKLQKSNNLFN